MTSPVFIPDGLFDRGQNVLRSYGEIFRNPLQEPLEHQKHHVIATGDDGRVFCVEIVGGMALAATNWFNASMVRGG